MSTSGGRSKLNGHECTQGGVHILECFVRLDKICVHHVFREKPVIIIELEYLIEHLSIDGPVRGNAPDPLKE